MNRNAYTPITADPVLLRLNSCRDWGTLHQMCIRDRYKGTNTTLNSSKQARIDMDYYESSGWGDWGSKSAQPLSGGSDKKQDEYLISPVVDLTGKTPTLSFDYLLHRYTAVSYTHLDVYKRQDQRRDPEHGG